VNPTPPRLSPPLPRRARRQAWRETGTMQTIEAPPLHPTGKNRQTRRSNRLHALSRRTDRRPTFRAPRPAPSPFPPLLRGRPTTPEQDQARTDRRRAAQDRRALRIPRRQRLRDLREVQSEATKSDLRALLHRLARDRRDGV
jgi:hypothetical protein